MCNFKTVLAIEKSSVLAPWVQHYVSQNISG